MIIQLSITNDRAAKILEAIGQPFERGLKTEFRPVGHNATKEVEVEVLLVQVGNSYIPAKEWIEEQVNGSLIDLIKQGINVKK